jgi:hypothetical protein
MWVEQNKLKERTILFLWINSPYWARVHYRGFTITLRHTTLDRTPLGEWPARTETSTWQHKHSWETSMSSAGFEPAIPASDRPQIHALGHAAGHWHLMTVISNRIKQNHNVKWRYYINYIISVILYQLYYINYSQIAFHFSIHGW